MRVFWRSSLFSYVPRDPDEESGYDGFRITVFTFSKPVSKRRLKKILGEWLYENEEKEPGKVAYEKKQVGASDSRGLGFNWCDISKIEYSRGQLSQPETRLDVFNLSAYEKNDVRLGYAEFLSRAFQYGKDRSVRDSLGRKIVSFWEWLTR